MPSFVRTKPMTALPAEMPPQGRQPIPGHRLDRALGERVRARRNALGLSQRDMAEALGITFQQVQKYERGANRISFSRLVEIATVLKVSLGELAAGLESAEPPANLTALNALRSEAGALEMLEAYAALPPALRRPMIHHAREILRALEGPGRSAHRSGR